MPADKKDQGTERSKGRILMTHKSLLWLLLLACLGSASAQQLQPVSSAASEAVVPTLVNFSGILTGFDGKPLVGIVGVTFSLYEEEQSASPVWLETQTVTADKGGHYSVSLGSTKEKGLPAAIFAD